MQETKSKFIDVVLWIAVALVTLIAFVTNYYFNVTGPTKALIWLIWLLASGAISFFTSQGQSVFNFAKESKIELQKVVWPNRQETIQTTTIVMVMVGVTSFILWGIDSGMMWAIAKLTHLG